MSRLDESAGRIREGSMVRHRLKDRLWLIFLVVFLVGLIITSGKAQQDTWPDSGGIHLPGPPPANSDAH